MRSGCSGVCCVTKSSPRRATASASRWRSSAPSRWIRTWTTPILASGCIRYYADVAPATAKVLRFLLRLPGGNKTEGLAQMLRARTRGRLLQGEAEYQLQIIYLWYEHRTDEAVAILESLHDRYPGNPLFLQRISPRCRIAYQHDITASLATWRTLLALAREQRLNESEIAEAQARLGVAASSTRSARPITRSSSCGRWSSPSPRGRSALSRRPTSRSARRRIVSGNRDAAVAAYRAAIDAAPVTGSAATSAARAAERHQTRARREPGRGLSPLARRIPEARTVGPRRRRSRCSRAASRSTRRIRVARYRYGRVLQAKAGCAGARRSSS